MSKLKIENLKLKIGRAAGFTLIELLVVITIMSLLAALIAGTAGLAKSKARISRTKVELQNLVTAIEHYKAVKGMYPPDNALPLNGTANSGYGTTTNNPLYYELTGALVLSGTPPKYLGGDGDVLTGDTGGNVQTLFGTGGFINSSPMTNELQHFLPDIKAGQMGQFYFPGASSGPTYTLLGAAIPGPPGIELQTINKTIFNPWHYRSTNPAHNNNTYDLWMDISVGGKTNRISNWSADPEVVTSPALVNNQP